MIEIKKPSSLNFEPSNNSQVRSKFNQNKEITTPGNEKETDGFSNYTHQSFPDFTTEAKPDSVLVDPNQKTHRKERGTLANINDVLSKNSILSAAMAAERKGVPFFFVEFKEADRRGLESSRHTSAANFYDRHDELYQKLNTEKFQSHSSTLYMSTSTLHPAVKICPAFEIYAEDHYMTDAQRSIFYLNADKDHEIDSSDAKSAIGFVAAMLLDGHILPQNTTAAEKIVNNIEKSRRSEILSPALTYYAERGDTFRFNRWISLGADISSAMKQGFNPLKDAILNHRWDLTRVILKHDLGAVPTETLERQSRSAALSKQDDIAASIQDIITKRG